MRRQGTWPVLPRRGCLYHGVGVGLRWCLHPPGGATELLRHQHSCLSRPHCGCMVDKLSAIWGAPQSLVKYFSAQEPSVVLCARSLIQQLGCKRTGLSRQHHRASDQEDSPDGGGSPTQMPDLREQGQSSGLGLGPRAGRASGKSRG